VWAVSVWAAVRQELLRLRAEQPALLMGYTDPNAEPDPAPPCQRRLKLDPLATGGFDGSRGPEEVPAEPDRPAERWHRRRFPGCGSAVRRVRLPPGTLKFRLCSFSALFAALRPVSWPDALIQPYSGHESRQSLEIYSRLALAGAQQHYDEAITRVPCRTTATLGWATFGRTGPERVAARGGPPRGPLPSPPARIPRVVTVARRPERRAEPALTQLRPRPLRKVTI